MAQAEIARRALTPLAQHVEIVPMTTRGDAISARRPGAGWVATDGQFTRDLEAALGDGRVDVVVHSQKDLPTDGPPALVIGAVLERADPRDCLVTRDGSGLADLPFGARIGTSSPRRAAQLAAARIDLVTVPIRGNVDTRLRRVERGEIDGIVLAAAGLTRLGVPIPSTSRLPLGIMLPAPGQGALALQIRADDERLRTDLATVDHAATHVAVDAERALLRRIGGGCLAALGAIAEVDDGTLRLRAAYEDGTGAFVRAEADGPVTHPDAVVDAVATEIEGALAHA